MRYFAYGSNMNLPALRAYLALHHIDPVNIRHPEKAILHDYRLRTNYLRAGSTGAANIEAHVGARVEGLLMEITPAVHRLLRRKEGWAPHGEGRYCETAIWASIPSTGSIAVALAYMVTSEYRLDKDMPVDPIYRQTILEGARQAVLSRRYQQELKRLLRTKERNTPNASAYRQYDLRELWDRAAR